MKIINFFSGPGTGKTTLALKLSAELKMLGKNIEYIPEYAKLLVYDEAIRSLEDQENIFNQQRKSIFRLRDKVDIVVTDAPLFNSIVYSGKGEDHKAFHNYIMWKIGQYDNLNIFLERETEYKKEGRHQDEAGAKEVDEEVLRCFKYFNVNYVKIGLNNAIPTIIELL